MLFFAIALIAIIIGMASISSLVLSEDEQAAPAIILISALIVGTYAILFCMHYSAINIGTYTVVNKIELTNDKIIYKCLELYQQLKKKFEGRIKC